MKLGFKLAIETTNGLVGIFCSNLGNCFKIFYPLGININDEIVNDILNITLEKRKRKGKIDNHWYGKYYFENLSDGSRLCIGSEDQHLYCYNLYTIENMHLKSHYVGHLQTNTIFIYHLEDKKNFYLSESSILAVQAYKDRFLQLLVKIANIVGNIKSVNLQSDVFLYTPELLEKEGYLLKYWKEFNSKYCYTEDLEREIILKSEGSLLSWSTIIRYDNISCEDWLWLFSL